MFNDKVIKTGPCKCVPTSLFKSSITEEEIMEDSHLNKELQLMSAQQTITHLISCLKDLQGKEPAFAGAAVADAILAFKALLKTHCNADAEVLQIACGSMGVALMNACTTNQAAIRWANDDERIFDYQVRDFLRIEDEGRRH